MSVAAEDRSLLCACEAYYFVAELLTKIAFTLDWAALAGLTMTVPCRAPCNVTNVFIVTHSTAKLCRESMAVLLK